MEKAREAGDRLEVTGGLSLRPIRGWPRWAWAPAAPSLTPQVLTAQQLPKLNAEKPHSIVDPLVRVEIHGVPADCARQETDYVLNNGGQLLAEVSGGDCRERRGVQGGSWGPGALTATPVP